MKPTFETGYTSIINRINSIDPVTYAKTRNYVDGAVTYLSPFISRGVISTKMVLKSVLDRGFKWNQIEPFIKELAWRDYFQRVWQEKDIDLDLKQKQEKVTHFEIPKSVTDAATGIQGIDQAIKNLYETGYMHNHCRMYVASLVCNIGQAHWKNPAHWMYYHLLDGDWASNACSWQWVAGTNSNKKYYVNQENISRFTRTPNQKSYLNLDYEFLPEMEIPENLKLSIPFCEKSILPEYKEVTINPELPTFVYNYYNLDPIWNREEKANRVLLLEPALFEKYPVSQKCIEFTIALSKNIPDIQLFTGNFEHLKAQHPTGNFIFKEHPLNSHYKGTEEHRDWISPEVTGHYPSFFAYWKAVEKNQKKHPFNV